MSFTKGSYVIHGTKHAKCVSIPDRDGWVKLEYAEKEPEQKVNGKFLKASTKALFEEFKWKSSGFDDKTWAVGGVVATTLKSEELLGTTLTKMKFPSIGKLVTKPDKNGEVKMEYPDGTRSGMVKASTLMRVADDQWAEAVEKTKNVHGSECIQKHSVGKDTRGAKPPAGLDMSMFLTSEVDMKIAFDMLDTDHVGSLDRTKARNWLRCMGWCLSDAGLDEILFTGHAVNSGRTHWHLDILAELSDQNRTKENLGLEALEIAIRRLAHYRAKIPKEKLTQFATSDRDLTPEHLAEIYSSLGMATASSIDCKELARKLLQQVCDPPREP